MNFLIFKKLPDEAGNFLYFEDGVFTGDESQIIDYLLQLNTEEGYEHIAEIRNSFGSRVFGFVLTEELEQ